MKQEFTTELLEKIVARLKDSINPEAIYLFGSYASGQAKEDSDIDLLIVIPDLNQERHDVVLKGRRSLRDIIFPIDLIVSTQAEMQKWADVKCTLIYTVTRKGKILYESERRTSKRMAQTG